MRRQTCECVRAMRVWVLICWFCTHRIFIFYTYTCVTFRPTARGFNVLHYSISSMEIGRENSSRIEWNEQKGFMYISTSNKNVAEKNEISLWSAHIFGKWSGKLSLTSRVRLHRAFSWINTEKCTCEIWMLTFPLWKSNFSNPFMKINVINVYKNLWWADKKGAKIFLENWKFHIGLFVMRSSNLINDFDIEMVHRKFPLKKEWEYTKNPSNNKIMQICSQTIHLI